MTETQLQNLDFNKIEEPTSPNNPGYYYYERSLGEIYLLSNADDEAEESGWEVYLYDYDNIVFTDADDLNHFITLINSNTR